MSLDAQRAKLHAYALAMDLELVEIIVDEGRSAKTLERRGLQTALSMLTQGQPDVLLVTKLDRLTRSVKGLGFLVERYFASGRYSLLSVSDSIDTRSPSGRLVLNVLGSVAQWEREAVVERTKEAMAEIKAQGYSLGQPGYGYRHSKQLDEHGRQIIEEHPVEQAGLRRILELFDAGTSVAPIIVALTAERAAMGRRGPWHRGLVYRILKRAGRLSQEQTAPASGGACTRPERAQRASTEAASRRPKLAADRQETLCVGLRSPARQWLASLHHRRASR